MRELLPTLATTHALTRMRLPFLGLLILAAGCGRSEPPADPAAEYQRKLALMPAEQRAAVEEYDRVVEKWGARDRAELVRPAPPDFKPVTPEGKLELRLIPQKSILRKGEDFWYRLELQNVGGKPIWWADGTWSFFKDGSLENDASFVLVEPDGRRQKVPLPFPISAPFGSGTFTLPKSMSEKQKEGFLRSLRSEPRSLHVTVELHPGEILVSRAWKHQDRPYQEIVDMRLRGQDPDFIPGLYRQLYTPYRFSRPGTYKLNVQIKSLYATVESNTITFEVAP